MTSSEQPSPNPDGNPSFPWIASRLLALVSLLYLFFVSIGLMGKSFKLFGGGLVDGLIEGAADPMVGLFAGLLTTAVIQSSSTTTSIVVTLVASGGFPVALAIPVIMGANIGTTVTNILVSLGHIGREKEFVRAFAASTVHDFFNMLAVLVLFPLQVWTNFLGRFASYLAGLFENAGGLKFANPLKAATGPVVKALVSGLGENPWLVLPVSLLLLFVALRLLVSLMKSLILGRVGSFFDQVIFKNAGRAMLFGLVLTVLVQSSSTTTSLIVPLAGVGLLTLTQVYPFTLGANVGTTITALLASLEGGTVSGVTVAFAHSLFNLSGIALIWPIPAIRRVPVQMATRLALATRKRRWVPFAFVGTAFFVVPILIILVLR